MKIHYRIRKDQIEIVRCFGADPQIVLPEQIGGLAVTQTVPYAFSDRKGAEEEDVLVYETEGHRMFRDDEALLAGETVERVAFPDTMQKIGRYVFYGCRNLKELSFSDRLEDIGSGAFTGCRSLSRLEVNLTEGNRTCVKEILGDLWQRINVTLRKGAEEARLVFPEHYEEAVENTPARILYTSHHGSGGYYRQCFYERKLDFAKYDARLPWAVADEAPETVAELALKRLRFPVGLSDRARESYEGFLRDEGAAAARFLVTEEDTEGLKFLLERELLDGPAIETGIQAALDSGKTALVSLLMEERGRRFPRKQKTFEL